MAPGLLMHRPLKDHHPAAAGLSERAATGARHRLAALTRQLEHQIELYDLSNDIGESENIAADHPGVTDRLTAELKDWIQATSPADSKR